MFLLETKKKHRLTSGWKALFQSVTENSILQDRSILPDIRHQFFKCVQCTLYIVHRLTSGCMKVFQSVTVRKMVTGGKRNPLFRADTRLWQQTSRNSLNIGNFKDFVKKMTVLAKQFCELVWNWKFDIFFFKIKKSSGKKLGR